jgi:hypothetical protein
MVRGSARRRDLLLMESCDMRVLGPLRDVRFAQCCSVQRTTSTSVLPSVLNGREGEGDVLYCM